MTELIMCVGLPASGKSTWAREIIQENPPGTVVRVNKDDLRAMMHDGLFKARKTEPQILAVRDAIIAQALGNPYVTHVIVDDTNFAPQHEQRLRELAQEFSATFWVKSFTDVPLAECIRRDLKRANSVGHKVINKMHLQYLTTPRQPPEYDDNLIDVVIVDIDGTLAHLNGRSPYDYSEKVLTDTVDETVLGLIRQLDAPESRETTGIILVSGRKDSCRDHTIEWLERHGVPYWGLFMRAADDNRPDDIVKGEIYEREILGEYNVRFVLDDRDQVVAMWRARGLKVLQVADGDF